MSATATETGVFNYTEFYDPDSTAIAGAWYNEDTEELVVEFPSGDKFIYFNVSEGLWDDFINHYSAGRFYSQNIKGQLTGSYLGDVDFNCVDSKARQAATQEAATKYPEATRYVVVWHDGDEVGREADLGGNSEDEALRLFWEQVQRSEEFLGKSLVVKVKAVIHYF